MTYEERGRLIAHLTLHGYVPYANQFEWVAIWDGERGRMAKWFEDTADGPAWDVRVISSDLALATFHEVPWHRLDNDQLKKLTVDPLPPKVHHRLPDMKDPRWDQPGSGWTTGR